MDNFGGFDEDTFQHSIRVGEMAREFITYIGSDEEAIGLYESMGLLHDIGKTQIPIEIIRKTGGLTEEERAIINQHPIYSETILKNELGETHNSLLRAVRGHHENFNGTGYPDFLRGENIPLGARVIRLLDSYDAMTHERPYQKNILTTVQAIERINLDSGTIFDPMIVSQFETFIRKPSQKK